MREENICLIVDDDQASREISSHIMNTYGFKTIWAEDGQEASSFCSVYHPKVVLLDWNMPVMDGIEFLKILRSDPENQEVQVIMCTCESDQTKVQEAVNYGVNGYIIKPFNRSEIQRQLKNLQLIK